MRRDDSRTTRPSLLAVLIPLALAAGCAASGTPAAARRDPLFYPPPPERPRLQHLASFSDSRDLEEPPTAFQLFVLGERKPEDLVFINKPYGLAFDGARLHVCDPNGGPIEVLDLARKEVSVLRPTGYGHLKTALNVAFGPDGERYVVDRGRRQVVVSNAAGEYVGVLGDGKADSPNGLAVSDAHVFVSDLKAHRIDVYDRATRKRLRSFGKNGQGPGEFHWPINLAVDPAGNVLAVDMLNCRVQRLSPEGEVLQVFGKLGRSLGEFVRPKGIACDREGRVYVVDSAFQNVQIFGPDGKLLLFFGDPGTGDGGLVMPAQVAVDYTAADHLQHLAAPGHRLAYVVAVTSQFGPRKVNVYGFLEQAP